MKDLEELLNQPVVVLTADGRCLAGLVHSFDSTFNLTLKKCHERIYPVREGADLPDKDRPLTLSMNKEGEADGGGGVQAVQLQSIVLRGDMVVCIGRVDKGREQAVDFARLAVPHALKPIVH
jgi:small nuclear ribonucleoprotein (snRNP)-like protein